MTQSSSGSRPPGEPQFGVSPSSGGGGYCTACGAAYGNGQTYCGRCGSRLIAEAQTDDISGGAASTYSGLRSGASDPDPQLAGVAADDPPYGTGATVGAVLVSVFMPFIALIVALGLRSQEHRPRRRQFLKSWAIGSAIWLCTGWLIPIIAFSAASSGASGCQGGIDQLVPPSYQSSDGVHWQATYTCMNGGTETRPVPSSQVPGG
jgi:hypothetical protein